MKYIFSTLLLLSTLQVIAQEWNTYQYQDKYSISVPSTIGIQHFDIYEILPRVLILITAYFLLKSYNTKQSSNTKEKMFNSRTNIRFENNNLSSTYKCNFLGADNKQ